MNNNSFDMLGIPQPILDALKKINFVTPTPIQTLAIPVALEGRDVMGSAQTGTGKTGAFSIPLIAHLIENPDSIAVVQTPTRELAMQVMKAIQDMLDQSLQIKTALLIGGDSMQKQLQQLKRNPRIIVGTPGRTNDHLGRHSLKLGNADFLVLDEFDRMLDMGFSIQVEKIVERMNKNRQTLMFSATLSSDIKRLAAGYLHNPERVSVGSTSQPIKNIKQEVVKTSLVEKYDNLVKELDNRSGSIIIFMKTKRSADKMARRLNTQNHSAEALHGDLRHNRRERVINGFRNKKHRILVATDVAARGLDIPHIEHVINYDLPQCPEDYIHRIGRTARAGASGTAVALITPQDGGKWNAIQRLIDPENAPAASSGRGNQSGARRNGKSKNRKVKRFSFKGHSRKEGRNDNQSESRGDNRGNARNSGQGDNRGGSRGHDNNESRGDNRGGSRGHGNNESRGNNRNGGKKNFRKDSNRTGRKPRDSKVSKAA